MTIRPHYTPFTLQELHGATMWRGPAFRRGAINFTMSRADGGIHCRQVDIIVPVGEKAVRFPCERKINLEKEGFEIFVSGQGMIGQLKRLLARIGGFTASLEPGGMIIEAQFYDESKRQPLRWNLCLSHEQLQGLLLDVSEYEQSPGSPARCFYDLYSGVKQVAA